jgi:hypothetical protein
MNWVFGHTTSTQHFNDTSVCRQFLSDATAHFHFPLFASFISLFPHTRHFQFPPFDSHPLTATVIVTIIIIITTIIVTIIAINITSQLSYFILTIIAINITSQLSILLHHQVDTFKLWLMWKAMGDQGFSDRIDHLCSKADYMHSRFFFSNS